MNKAVMEQYGIDCQKGITRCLEDEKLYEQILHMFLEEDAFARAQAAYDACDWDALLTSVHELKGSSGTASLTELYAAACALVACLRAGNPDRRVVDTLFAALSAAYDRARTGITLAFAD